MQEFLNQITEICSILSRLLEDVRKKDTALQFSLTEAEKQKAVLEAKDIELIGRETAVSSVESVVKIKEENQKEKATLVKLRESIAKEQIAVNKAFEAFELKNKEMVHTGKLLTEREIKLVKDNDALEKEKLTYKDKVREDIKKTL